MRATLLLLLPLVACTPDIAPGSYACGPNASCPDDEQCNPADNKCVLPGFAEEFACTPDLASEPDDTSDTAAMLTGIDCITSPVAIESCMAEGDTADWYQLTAPSGCASLVIDASIRFPVAFESLTLALVDLDTSTTLATSEDCATNANAALAQQCVSASLTAGGHYGLHVTPTGDGDCGGDCAFNRYTLGVQLGPQ